MVTNQELVEQYTQALRQYTEQLKAKREEIVGALTRYVNSAKTNNDQANATIIDDKHLKNSIAQIKRFIDEMEKEDSNVATVERAVGASFKQLAQYMDKLKAKEGFVPVMREVDTAMSSLRTLETEIPNTIARLEALKQQLVQYEQSAQTKEKDMETRKRSIAEERAVIDWMKHDDPNQSQINKYWDLSIVALASGSKDKLKEALAQGQLISEKLQQAKQISTQRQAAMTESFVAESAITKLGTEMQQAMAAISAESKDIFLKQYAIITIERGLSTLVEGTELLDTQLPRSHTLNGSLQNVLSGLNKSTSVDEVMKEVSSSPIMSQFDGLLTPLIAESERTQDTTIRKILADSALALQNERKAFIEHWKKVVDETIRDLHA